MVLRRAETSAAHGSGLTDEFLRRVIRKWAGNALSDDDVLLDIDGGPMARFRLNGVDQPIVTLKRWARAIPLTRGLTIATYTQTQILFMGDGFASNGPLVGVMRAEVAANGKLTIMYTPGVNQYALLEIDLPSRSGGRARTFADRLLAARDARRATLPVGVQEILRTSNRPTAEATLEELWQRGPLPG